MNPLEISFISLANYFAYMVISRKVIRDSSCPVRRSKTLVMVALIIMSISMGFIAMSPIGEYSFIIGLIVSILFTYFLYGLDLWNTLLVFIVTNMILFASGYISILVTRFLSGNDGLYFKDWLLAQQTNIFLLFLIYRYLPINILMKFKIHRNNRILSGFLYEKYRRAETMGVDFTIIIDDYDFKTNLKDYELVEIVGNLINNAFESNTKDNKVILNLTAEDDMSLIEIKNKYPFLNSSGISQLFMSGYSTKSKDGRGIGLPNVRKIISNHGGMLQVQNDTIDDENYLVFRILLKKYK